MKSHSELGATLFVIWLIGSTLWIGYGYYHWFLDDIDEQNLSEPQYQYQTRLSSIERHRDEFWLQIWRAPLAIFFFGSGIFWAGRQLRKRRRRTFE